MKLNYNAIKTELKNRKESTKHFTKAFYNDYKQSVEKRLHEIETGKNNYYYRDNILLNHAYDNIYKSKFYNENTCAYCVFLEIVCGEELA